MRRASIPFLAGVIFCIFLFTWFLLPSEHSARLKDLDWPTGGAQEQTNDISEELLHGGGIMPALGNETAKYGPIDCKMIFRPQTDVQAELSSGGHRGRYNSKKNPPE